MSKITLKLPLKVYLWHCQNWTFLLEHKYRPFFCKWNSNGSTFRTVLIRVWDNSLLFLENLIASASETQEGFKCFLIADADRRIGPRFDFSFSFLAFIEPLRLYPWKLFIVVSFRDISLDATSGSFCSISPIFNVTSFSVSVIFFWSPFLCSMT